MPDDDHGRGPEERDYRVQRQERLHRIRVHLRRMEDHLSEMDGHLRELDSHLRHEEEETERWHRKWDRHTCATLLLARNVNPKIVSEMLGHSSISITLDTYSHVLPDMQDPAARALEDALL